MSVPTCRALCYSGADCLSGVRTYLPGTVLHWCRLFKQYPNLLAGHCVTVVKTIYAVWEPTCRALCYSCNLPTGHCVTVVQTVLAMSVPTCRALCYSGADCLSGVRTYLPGTVLHWCRLFKQYPNLLAGHCVTVVKTIYAVWEPTCRALCYSCNLPTGHCVTVVQTVLAMSVPTCRALCYSCADCLSNVSTYLPGTVLQWCRLCNRCPKLPARHCVTVLQTV